MSSATDKTVTVEVNPTAINKQSDVIPGATPTKAGVMTAQQAKDLADIVAGTVSSVSGTAPIISSGGLNPDISITPATTLVAGSMSAADKAKLNGIVAGAAVASVSGTAPIVSSGGVTPAISIAPATTLVPGSMSAADKSKLNGLPPTTSVTARTVGATSADVAIFDLPANSAALLRINVCAVSDNFSSSGTFEATVNCTRSGAANASVFTYSLLRSSLNSDLSTISIFLNNTAVLGVFTLTVTGRASRTIDWTVSTMAVVATRT